MAFSGSGASVQQEEPWRVEMIIRNVGELIKDQAVISLEPEASVQEAAEKMAEHRVGTIAVLELGKLRGIFTERDLLNRVVAKGLRPQEVRVEEVMTQDPVTVTSDTGLVVSLTLMHDGKFRHLPVLEEGGVVGVLSCRDIPISYQNLHERWEEATKGPVAVSA
jgi:CBS domain-containing protein